MIIPKHCPNPYCSNFTEQEKGHWYQKYGQYYTYAFGFVQRFLCLSCKKSFSEQTFSLDYYVKKPIDYEVIHQRMASASGLRNVARDLEVTPEVIGNRIGRLARNAVLLHEGLLKKAPFEEDFVADGFESFCVSQFFPDNYNIFVGKESQFVYFCDHVYLRRKGRMTDKQKIERERLEKHFKAQPSGIERSFRELAGLMLDYTAKRKTPVILYTDMHYAYVRAICRNKRFREKFEDGSLVHVRISSREPRGLSSHLFAVNYMDRELRKDMGSHVRETVKFGKNTSDAMNRFWLYLFHHNLEKPFRVAKPDEMRFRHGEIAGISRQLIDDTIKQLLSKRCFWLHGGMLSRSALKTIYRKWETPLKTGREPEGRHLYRVTRYRKLVS